MEELVSLSALSSAALLYGGLSGTASCLALESRRWGF